MSVADTRAHVAAPPAPAPRTWLRKRRRTRFFAGYAFVLSAFWIALLVDVEGNRLTYERNGGLVLFVLLFLALAAASAWLGVRVARCGLWIGADEIAVRGPLRTSHIPTGSAERFEPRVQGAGNGTPCPVLMRSQGSPVAVWALGSEAFTFGYRRALGDMQPLCEELNGLLASVRPAARSSAGA